MSIYDIEIIKRDDTKLNLSEFKGKVLLIVNTATGCGKGFNIKYWSEKL